MAQVTMNCKWRMQRSQQWDSYGKLLYLFLFWGKCFSLIYIYIYIYYCIYIYINCVYIYIYTYIYVYIWTPEMGLEGVFLSSLEQPGRNAKKKHTFQGHRSSFRWINPRLRRSRLMHGHFHAVETCRRQFVIGWVGMCQRLIIWWLSPTLW